MEKEEEVVAVLRRSRKAYLIEYACGLFLLIAIGILSLKGMAMPFHIRSIALSFAAFAIMYAEISRQLIRYIITPQKLIVIQGIIRQFKTNVYFRPLGFVPDINLHQNRLQRLLGYGTIFVRGGGTTNSFELKDINHPQDIIELVERLVEDNRGSMESRPTSPSMGSRSGVE